MKHVETWPRGKIIFYGERAGQTESWASSQTSKGETDTAPSCDARTYYMGQAHDQSGDVRHHLRSDQVGV
jgi:hypothetical protein